MLITFPYQTVSVYKQIKEAIQPFCEWGMNRHSTGNWILLIQTEQTPCTKYTQ